jgi:hypothetical protein
MSCKSGQFYKQASGLGDDVVEEEAQMSSFTVDEQIEIMEKQIHSSVANFTLMEKMQYLTEYFGNDPEFSKEAADIVRSNICRNMKKEGH